MACLKGWCLLLGWPFVGAGLMDARMWGAGGGGSGRGRWRSESRSSSPATVPSASLPVARKIRHFPADDTPPSFPFPSPQKGEKDMELLRLLRMPISPSLRRKRVLSRGRREGAEPWSGPSLSPWSPGCCLFSADAAPPVRASTQHLPFPASCGSRHRRPALLRWPSSGRRSAPPQLQNHNLTIAGEKAPATTNRTLARYISPASTLAEKEAHRQNRKHHFQMVGPGKEGWLLPATGRQ